MPLYGFSDRNVAKRLKQIAATPEGLTISEGLRHTDVFLFKTPSDGIPAASGGVYGKAVCDAYYLSFDGTDASEAELKDSSGTTITATVFNKSSRAVPGNTVIQVVRCYGLYLENWTDCDA